MAVFVGSSRNIAAAATLATLFMGRALPRDQCLMHKRLNRGDRSLHVKNRSAMGVDSMRSGYMPKAGERIDHAPSA